MTGCDNLKYTRRNKGQGARQSSLPVAEVFADEVMGEPRKSETPAKFRRMDSETLLLDFNTINRMTTGTCIIPQNQEIDDAVVVCKEGKMIKIFRIVGE